MSGHNVPKTHKNCKNTGTISAKRKTKITEKLKTETMCQNNKEHRKTVKKSGHMCPKNQKHRKIQKIQT